MDKMHAACTAPPGGAAPTATAAAAAAEEGGACSIFADAGVTHAVAVQVNTIEKANFDEARTSHLRSKG
jgi:hypothetical protein